jgi:hypothetical protein
MKIQVVYFEYQLLGMSMCSVRDLMGKGTDFAGFPVSWAATGSSGLAQFSNISPRRESRLCAVI